MYDPLRRRIVQSLAFLPFLGNTIVKGSTQTGTKDLASRVSSQEMALTAVRFFNTLEASQKLKYDSFVSMQALRNSKVLSKTLKIARTRKGSRPPVVEELISRMDPDATELIPGWTLQLHTSEEGGAYLLTLRSLSGVFVSDESGVIYRGNLLADAKLPKAYAPISDLQPFDLLPLRAESAMRKNGLSSLVRRVAFLGLSASPMEDHCEHGNCSGGASYGCCNLGYQNCVWCCYSGCDAACLFCGMGVECYCPIG